MADINVGIRATDKTKRAFSSADRGLKKVGASAKKTSISVGKLAASFGLFAVAARAGGAALSFVKEAIDLAAKQEAAEKKLEVARRRLGGATLEATSANAAFASSLQVATGVGDEAIFEIQALLLNIGRISEEELPAATKATLDWSAALGKDLNSSALDVAKALSGNVMMLQRYGVEIDKADVEARGATAVLEKLNEQFGGEAQARMETYAGRIDGMSAAWGDFKEVIGEVVTASDTVNHSIAATTVFIEQMSAALTDGGKAAARFKSMIGGFLEAGPIGGLPGFLGVLTGGQAERNIQGTLSGAGSPLPLDPVTQLDPDEIIAALMGGGSKKGKGGKGGKRVNRKFRTGQVQEMEAARAAAAEAQKLIDERIAAQDRLTAALERTRRELIDLRDADDEATRIANRLARETAREAQAELDLRLQEAEAFKTQMTSLMTQAGAQAMQALVAGMRGEKDAFKQFLRGILPVIGQALGLALGGPGGAALGGTIGGGLGGLLHQGGVVRAHSGIITSGLNPGEVDIRAQTGEAVTTRELTRSIGEDRINEGNRTGKLPGDGGGDTYIIHANDSKSFDDSIRRGDMGRSMRKARRRGSLGGGF